MSKLVDELIPMILKMSNDQIDDGMRPYLQKLVGQPDEVQKPGLHEVLDYCAHGALASSFVMKSLDMLWKSVGGKVTDPAPWRERHLTHK